MVVQANVSGQAGQSKVGDLVYRGDVVQTGADGRVGINFTDGTSFNLSSNARMALSEFVYDPNGKSNSTLFNLSKGTFTFVAGKIAKTGDMKIDTPVATMGVRGTTPHIEISDDGTVKFSTLIEEGKSKLMKKAAAPAAEQKIITSSISRSVGGARVILDAQAVSDKRQSGRAAPTRRNQDRIIPKIGKPEMEVSARAAIIGGVTSMFILLSFGSTRRLRRIRSKDNYLRNIELCNGSDRTSLDPRINGCTAFIDAGQGTPSGVGYRL